MPDNRSDLNQYLKGIGGNRPPPAAAPSPPGGAQASDTAPPLVPPEPGYWQSYGVPVATGAGRELVNLVGGGAKLMGRLGGVGALSEATGLNEAAGQAAEENIPVLRRMREFSEAEPEPGNEGLEATGHLLTDATLSMLAPEFGLEGLAARAARYFPALMRTGAPVWVNPLGAGGRWMAGQTVRPGVRTAARAVDRAAQGGLSGAVADPDDPVTGAIAGGATGGALGPLVGRMLRSRAAQEYAGHLLRTLAGTAVGHAIGHALGIPLAGEIAGAAGGAGLPYAVKHAAQRGTARFGSPPGQMMERGTRYFFDKAGRRIENNPVAGGIWAGEAAKNTNEGRPVVTIPRRAGPADDAEPRPAENQ